MKDIIIGGYTKYNWNQLKNWVLSIRKTSFTGDVVLIAFETTKETVDKLEKHGVEVFSINKELNYKSKIPIHVERFIFIYHYLKTKKYRYVITTDVKDVVFQKNPVDWLENNIDNYKLVISSESIKYKDEPWGNDNLLQGYGKYVYNEFCNNEIFNVGVVAGEFSYVKDLMLHLFLMSTNRPIPIVDQASFNILINTEPWKSVVKRVRSEDGWACQLGTTADPTKLECFKHNLLENTPKIVENRVYTSLDDLFYIVHQYDRIPHLRTEIDNIYS